LRVNRVNYEICVLTALRERLRCKEIWVVGRTGIAIPMTICRKTSKPAEPTIIENSAAARTPAPSLPTFVHK